MKNKVKIPVKRKISLISALLAWLVLFLVPSIILTESIKRLLKETKERNIVKSKSLLINEMYQFKKDFTYTSFIHNVLKKVIDANVKSSRPNKIDLIVKKMTKEGIKTSILIRHGRDSQNIEFYYSDEIKNNRIMFPSFFTKNLLAVINKQYLYSFYNDKLSATYKSRYTNNKLAKQKKIAFGFLQKQLKLIKKAEIDEGIVRPSISGVLNSQIYILYISNKERIQNKKYIKEGFFLIVKASDISFVKIMNQAKISSDSNLIRSYSKLSCSIKEFVKNKVFKISSFTQDISGVILQSPFPHDTLVKFVQKGGIYPTGLENVTKNLPLMKVVYPSQKLEHPLKKYIGYFYVLMKFIVLLGAVLLLHSFLFGFEFNISLRNKSVIGILAIFLPPLLLSAYAVYFYSQSLNNRFERNKIRELEQYGELIQDLFSNFLVNKQISVFEFAKKIADTKSNINSLAKQWMQSAGVADVLIKTSDEKLNLIKNANIIETFPVSQEGKLARKIYADTMYNVSIKGILTQNFGITSEIINDLFLLNGKLNTFEGFSSDSMLSSVEIINEAGENKGIFMARFLRDKLISEFIETVAEKLANRYQTEKGIKTRYLLIDEKNRPYNYYRKSENKRNIPENVYLSAEKRVTINWDHKINNFHHLFNAKYILPCSFIALASISEPISEFSYSMPLLLFVYMIVFIAFMYVLFGEMYLKPIRSFVYVAGEIEKGNFKVTPEISSIIEFKKLKDAFGKLTYGIEQKEALSQFVSKDVLGAVESKNEIETGGEKIEATILFVCIDKFDNFIDSNTPEEVMDLMSKFMTLAEVEIENNNGVIDKIIEGSLMVVFKQETHVIDAQRAAIDIYKRASEANIIVKSGLATGIIVSGRIGSRSGRLDMTVIGDTVNMAARLKAEAVRDTKSTGILVAQSTISKMTNKPKLEFLRHTQIKGKSGEHALYELIELDE